jgi:hypothetical protein
VHHNLLRQADEDGKGETEEEHREKGEAEAAGTVWASLSFAARPLAGPPLLS